MMKKIRWKNKFVRVVYSYIYLGTEGVSYNITNLNGKRKESIKNKVIPHKITKKFNI